MKERNDVEERINAKLEDRANNPLLFALAFILLLVLVGVAIAIYQDITSLPDVQTLNDCTSQIVGNCIVK